MSANVVPLAVCPGSQAIVNPSLRASLGGIAIPTLVLWRESDQIVEPSYGQAYAAATRRTHFMALPDPGHMPQMETPDLVLQMIWDSGQGRNERPLTA